MTIQAHNLQIATSGLDLHRRKNSIILKSLLFWIFHYMQTNLILIIIKGKTRTKQPVDRPMLRKDAQAAGPPSGSPLAPLARRVFSAGGESKVATVPPVALVMGAAGLGPFGLNPCLWAVHWGCGVYWSLHTLVWHLEGQQNQGESSGMGGGNHPSQEDPHSGPG